MNIHLLDSSFVENCFFNHKIFVSKKSNIRLIPIPINPIHKIIDIVTKGNTLSFSYDLSNAPNPDKLGFKYSQVIVIKNEIPKPIFMPSHIWGKASGSINENS